MRTTYGEHLAGSKRSLDRMAEEKGIQLVTIGRPAAHGEYSPYTVTKDEQELVGLAQAMRS